ncbi:gfo/Idh/MocA family oxidoreductase, partial [Escherichia coli]|nr:gfo/Idh/MocA family oxidoreductase [Escherichia coli]
TAIANGWHVFLEKPPGATLAEVEALRVAAEAKGISLFASWHSRYAPGVEPARRWLADKTLRNVTITWRE